MENLNHIAMENERVFPLTISELCELTTHIPAQRLQEDTEVEIRANEDRACIQDLHTKTIISWIRRVRKPVAPG